MRFSFSALTVLRTLGLELLKLRMNSGQQTHLEWVGTRLAFGLLVLMDLTLTQWIESKLRNVFRLQEMILDL